VTLSDLQRSCQMLEAIPRPICKKYSSLFTPALLRTYSFVFFAVHKTRRIFLSPFISKAWRRVSSFFLTVQLSQPFATGHTSAFISRSWLKSVCCDFSIFSAVKPRSPAFCLTWCRIPSHTHHLLWSVTQVTETYPTAPVAHSEWVCGTLCRCSPLPWSCQRWLVGCIYGWLGLG